MTLRIVLIGLLLTAALAEERAYAQVDELERSRYNQAAYYRYAEPADVTILVNAWGAVRNPGLYELPQGTRLSKLFSLAGGPVIGEKRRGQRRTLTVRLARKQPGEAPRTIVFEAEMEDDVLAFDEDPVLQEGDVLTAETYVRPRFTWRDVLPIIGAAASVASTVLTIQILTSDSN